MKQILASIVPGSLSRAGASLTMWTLAFFPGAKIGVVGPNGAGKSTLLKMMGRLQEELDHREAWDLDSQLEQAMDALRYPPADAGLAGAGAAADVHARHAARPGEPAALSDRQLTDRLIGPLASAWQAGIPVTAFLRPGNRNTEQNPPLQPGATQQPAPAA
jgi:ABC transporter